MTHIIAKNTTQIRHELRAVLRGLHKNRPHLFTGKAIDDNAQGVVDSDEPIDRLKPVAANTFPAGSIERERQETTVAQHRLYTKLNAIHEDVTALQMAAQREFNAELAVKAKEAADKRKAPKAAKKAS